MNAGVTGRLVDGTLNCGSIYKLFPITVYYHHHHYHHHHLFAA